MKAYRYRVHPFESVLQLDWIALWFNSSIYSQDI